MLASWQASLERAEILEQEREGFRRKAAQLTARLSEAEAKLKARHEASIVEEEDAEGVAEAAMMPVVAQDSLHLRVHTLPRLLAEAQWPVAQGQAVPDQKLPLSDVELVLRDFWRECAFSALDGQGSASAAVLKALRDYFAVQAGGQDAPSRHYAANVIVCCQSHSAESAEARLFLAIFNGDTPAGSRGRWLATVDAIRAGCRQAAAAVGAREAPTLTDVLEQEGLRPSSAIRERLEPWQAASAALAELEDANSALSLLLLEAFLGSQ